VVADDLLQEKLLDWLEANSTITETVAAGGDSDAKPAGEAKAATKKTGSKKAGKADANA
jgi:trigger factor